MERVRERIKRIEKSGTRFKNEEFCCISSQIKMRQMKDEPKVKQTFRKKTEWSIERLKDKFTPTNKFEDTGECERRRRCTQVEIDDEWKKLREKFKKKKKKCWENMNWNQAEEEYKGRGNEPQWIIKEANCHQVKVVGRRE